MNKDAVFVVVFDHPFLRSIVCGKGCFKWLLILTVPHSQGNWKLWDVNRWSVHSSGRLSTNSLSFDSSCVNGSLFPRSGTNTVLPSFYNLGWNIFSHKEVYTNTL